MRLLSLQQLNYRNLNTPRVTFGGGVTAIVGRNAAGKSNLLEAVYLGLTGELPHGKIAEAVRLGESEGFVSVKLEHGGGLSTVQVGLAPGRKTVRLDGQSVRAFELARVSAAVLITPEDAELVHGPPALRRGYLDTLLSRLSLRYALLQREYTRVVEQRNAALKSLPYGDPTLEVWTERFVALGDEITALRERALARVGEVARASYAEISGDDKPLGVSHRAAAQGVGLRAALAATQHEERARGVTVVGPHRDDLELTLAGHSVQAYGSRGEARTVALALRVAEYTLLQEKLREAPVLLIDDFTAELDASRREFLLQLAARAPQALVSGTEAPPHAAAQLFIAGGDVRLERPA
ncbi:DNA replication/repair protein RecF [Truepera radiovictrix]|uniref:DNA replication and repair protein RecF n=1 Tax=Truepera radiovictrix (strain DSM 17093 / CIP 108686 / LMG 22925 / RQ-24) TaxID=649638 RepID=D7CXV0_TRURR|nr:DNA replication and repair protein RecF [Truepera radiovictrix]ADI13310.1 DNA replication and repair protein RecF [Truepera radiovictrix DSM 17093]WMT58126.1 DNA replication and repair protein RecF [Truepera radiovictrix]